MKGKRKFFALTALALVLSAGAAHVPAASADELSENEEIKAAFNQAIASAETDEKLEIMAYYGPSIGINLINDTLQPNKNSATVEDVKKYFDAGFDYIVAEDDWYYSYRYDTAAGRDNQRYDALYMLDLVALYCDEYGITDPGEAPVVVACGYLNGAMEGSYGDHSKPQIESNLRLMYGNLKAYAPSYPDGYQPKTNIAPLNCFAGFSLRDEPWGKHMEYYTEWYKFLVDDLGVLDEGYVLVGSLLGMNAAECNVSEDGSGSSGIGITAAQYTSYLEDYLAAVNETETDNAKETLMYDNYPFVERITRTRSGWFLNYKYSYETAYLFRERYFENLQVASAAAKVNGMRAGVCIQSMAIYNKSAYDEILGKGASSSYTYYGKLNGADYIGMQVYAALACGYKRLDYFTYWEPFAQTDAETFTDAAVMWDETGSGYHYTDMYDYMKEVNTEIKRFDDVFLRFGWLGTRGIAGTVATGNVYGSMQSYTGDGTANGVTAQYDLLLGCFSCGGLKGYMAVNVDHPANGRTNVASFDFGEEYSHAIAYIDGEQQILGLTDGKIQITIGCGEGVFLVPVRA